MSTSAIMGSGVAVGAVSAHGSGGVAATSGQPGNSIRTEGSDLDPFRRTPVDDEAVLQRSATGPAGVMTETVTIILGPAV
jgi:hypothetical protein